MTVNLIPQFIHEQFVRDSHGGRFTAAALFVDISGFAHLTETLMQGGAEGAEILSTILNRVFAPTLDAIAAYGGFVSTFAGDAFTALLPEADEGQVAEMALAAAAAVRDVFQRHSLHRTRFGDCSCVPASGSYPCLAACLYESQRNRGFNINHWTLAFLFVVTASAEWSGGFSRSGGFGRFAAVL